jgi:trans-aconitate 2-methyltransferase
MPWNPTQYLNFGSERLRPALDLLARVPLERPAAIVDLGCGAGNVTRVLQQRWPDAAIIGVDNSPQMLEQAARTASAIRWQNADLAHWSSPQPSDLIYSNAALHWLDDHPRLFPRLLRQLRQGGVLAIQMPDNFGEPSHTCAFEAAAAGPWRDRLAPLLRTAPVLPASVYYDLLAPLSLRVEIWQTEYLHVLDGNNPVAEWTRGSLLVPLLEALQGDERAAFESDYRIRVRAAYPARADGRTLFPFRRLFIVAER